MLVCFSGACCLMKGSLRLRLDVADDASALCRVLLEAALCACEANAFRCRRAFDKSDDVS